MNTPRGLYLGRLKTLCMDTSGDQSDEKQAVEKPIGVEEQRTIESQEAQAEEEDQPKSLSHPQQQLKKL